MVNPHDVLVINGASAALSLSGMPFDGPVGAVRIAYTTEGTWTPHPTYDEGEASTFEIVVAGREVAGDIAIVMVEAGGTEGAYAKFEEGAPKVTEAVIAEGLEASKQWIRESIDLQKQLREQMPDAEPIPYTVSVDYTPEVLSAVDAYSDRIGDVYAISDKHDRGVAEGELRDEIIEALKAQFESDEAVGEDAEKMIKAAFRSTAKKVVRQRIVKEGLRIDGRGTADIRPLSAEVAVLPSVHGSGLFQRGETQVLNVTTLGMPRMEQMLDTLDIHDRKRYMHHYNFPPYSTGETGFMRGPKRREIGHGALAERALVPVLPTSAEFPYTLRTVSDVLSSNGSTSMGSVCGSTLSLMDAGVPIKAPVAGIAMGLVHADDTYTCLTDILGAEDAYGDMDFKVAGTAEFVTALQLDTKIEGIPADVLGQALDQAKQARLAILEVMAGAIAEPREDVGATAPKIVSFEIPIDKIGEVIGPKGKVINAIQQETGADIAVDDDGTVGTVSIGSSDRGAVQEAERQIQLILNPPSAEVGEVYKGKVVNVTKFGAFVNILPGRDGLLHISKIGAGHRVERVEDCLDLGDEVEVRVDDIDQNGKVSLTPVEPIGFKEGRGGGSAPRGDRDRDRDRDRGGRDRGPRRHDDDGDGDAESGDRDYVSFEDSFDEEMREEFGDLGPADTERSDHNDRNDRPANGRNGGSRGRGGRGRSRSGGGGRGRRD
jgi:polyribonucleotide nucleotidyltransferase